MPDVNPDDVTAMARALGVTLLPDELPYLIAELAQMQTLARRLQERLDESNEPGLQPAAP